MFIGNITERTIEPQLCPYQPLLFIRQ